MPKTSDINPSIIEDLYREAIVLSNEVRYAFTQFSAHDQETPNGASVRMAVSSESLKATTRMMHATAWLINHRALLAGQIDEPETRRRGRLPARQGYSQPEQLQLIPAKLRSLIEESEHFYDRVERLNRAWRKQPAPEPSVVHQLREQIQSATIG